MIDAVNCFTPTRYTYIFVHRETRVNRQYKKQGAKQSMRTRPIMQIVTTTGLMGDITRLCPDTITYAYEMQEK